MAQFYSTSSHCTPAATGDPVEVLGSDLSLSGSEGPNVHGSPAGEEGEVAWTPKIYDRLQPLQWRI